MDVEEGNQEGGVMGAFYLVMLGMVGGFVVVGIKRAMRDCETPILWCLEREPGMYGLDLAQMTGISRSVIYYHLGLLEEAGKVRREEPPSQSGPGRPRYYLTKWTRYNELGEAP
jgi:hypothetical protein